MLPLLLVQISFKTSNANGITFNGTSYANNATGSYNCGTYNISGTFPSGYEFNSWSVSGSGSIASTSTLATTATISGATTITLTGKQSCSSTISGIMQTFNPCSTIANGATGSLTDSRDNQIYTIAKINGNYWMTRNLAIGCNGNGSTYGGSVSSKSLTTSNSHVSSAWSTPTTTINTGTYNVAGMVCSATYGAWYNYCAASAGTVCGQTANANYDVCPAGWRLPNNTELAGITSWASAFSPVYSGMYFNSTIYFAGEGGYWWSATTAYDDNRQSMMYYGSGSLSVSHNRKDSGNSIRCIRSS